MSRIRKFIPGVDGVVKSVSGVEAARKLDGVHEIEMYVKPGDRTRKLTSGADRIGHIIVFAESRAKAVDAANEAAGMIKVAYGN